MNTSALSTGVQVTADNRSFGCHVEDIGDLPADRFMEQSEFDLRPWTEPQAAP